jgi:hypothetical protein
MNILNRTLTLFLTALLLGFGIGVLYLVMIMYFITGHLPEITDLKILDDFSQLINALGGKP